MVRIYASDVTLNGFTVTNPDYQGGADASGILIADELGTSGISNIQVLNNIITAVRDGANGTPSGYGATAINVGSGPISDVTISGNIITNINNPNGAAIDHTCGINIWDGADGVVIENNDISGVKYNGILLQNAANVTIEKNTITNTDTGLKIDADAIVSGLTVESNKILDNTSYEVSNNIAAQLKAENNWFGTTNGAGIASKINGDIDYRPWCINADCTTDLNPPTVTVGSLITNNTTPAITGTVTDENAVTVIIEVNGIPYPATVTNNVWSATVSDILLEGTYNVIATAEDLAGNITTDSTTNELTIDVTSPTATVDYSTTEPTNQDVTATIIADETVNVTSEGGLSHVFSDNNSFTFTFVDLAGNTGSKLATVSNIDKKTPTNYSASINQEYVNNVNKTALSFTFTGAEVDATYDYSINDTDEGTIAINGSGTIVSADQTIAGINASSLSDGTLTLTVSLTDAAGNEGSDATDTIVKDIVSPSVSSNVPTNHAVGIDPEGNIVITFSEEVNLESEDIDVSGDINPSGNVVTITPSGLTNNTKYTVTLHGVTDLAGNVMNDYSWIFTTATRYSIDLKAGWNLISLPVTPTTWASTTSTLADIDGNVERVWSYDAVDGTWSIYNANGAPSDLDTMTAGRGYWVKMTGDDTLTGVGTLYEQFIPSGETSAPSVPPQIPLAVGWNLIGYYQLPNETTATVSNALSTLNGAWSTNTNHLFTFTKGSSPIMTPVSLMNPGDGYWIFMTSDREYTFGSAAND
jgi:parallel beta-helix repeat protein